MKKRLAGLALAAALLAQTGCATIYAMPGRPTPYTGVRVDLDLLDESFVWHFALYDLPFSFAADTALLPLTVPAGMAEVFGDAFEEHFRKPK